MISPSCAGATHRRPNICLFFLGFKNSMQPCNRTLTLCAPPPLAPLAPPITFSSRCSRKAVAFGTSATSPKFARCTRVIDECGTSSWKWTISAPMESRCIPSGAGISPVEHSGPRKPVASSRHESSRRWIARRHTLIRRWWSESSCASWCLSVGSTVSSVVSVLM